MAIPNHEDIIDRVLTRFSAQITAPADEVDGIGRRLLPHFIEAMPADERPNWGVLRKSTGTFPYDILVWKPTREHFDVLTSVEVDPAHDTRRLVGRWNSAGILPRPDWTWSDWHDSGIIPLGELTLPPEPEPEPEPPQPSDDIVRLTLQLAGLEQTVSTLAQANDMLSREVIRLREQVDALAHHPVPPPPEFELPELVAEGETSRSYYHSHTVSLKVRRA